MTTTSNRGTGGSNLNLIMGSPAPIYLAHDGENYVYLPGSASGSNNRLTSPDTIALRLSTVADIRVELAYNTLAREEDMVAKYIATGDQRGYSLRKTSTGTWQFLFSTDGTAGTTTSHSSPVDPHSAGVRHWVRCLFEGDVSGERRCSFFTSSDGVVWTPLGGPLTGATVSLHPSTDVFQLGNGTYSNSFSGKLFKVLVGNGSTDVFKADFTKLTNSGATEFMVETGQTVTVNRSTTGLATSIITAPCWAFAAGNSFMEISPDPLEAHVTLNGDANTYITTPDNDVLDITGNLSLIAKIAPNDWSPASTQTICAKRVDTGNQQSYSLRLNSAGALELTYSTDGSGAGLLSRTSTVNLAALPDGSTKWIAATLAVNESSNNVVRFWTSDDGATWAQLGSTVSNSGVITVFSGTAPFEIGSRNVGAIERFAGKVFSVAVHNAIGASGAVPTTGQVASFQACGFAPGNTTYKSYTNGLIWSANGLSAFHNLNPLNSNLSDFTIILTATSIWPAGKFSAGFVKIGNIATGIPGWGIYGSSAGAGSVRFAISDDTTVSGGTSVVDNKRPNVLALKRTSAGVSRYVNGSLLGTTGPNRSTPNDVAVRFGKPYAGGQDAQMYLYNALFFDRALTDNEIQAITRKELRKLGLTPRIFESAYPPVALREGGGAFIVGDIYRALNGHTAKWNGAGWDAVYPLTNNVAELMANAELMIGAE